MIAFPACKINIGLQLFERRPDGFHNLLSAFYPVDWSDALEIMPAPTFRFSTSGLPIPGGNVPSVNAPSIDTPGLSNRLVDAPSSNLCVRAYELLRADYDLPPVQIHLHKVVPIGAGLGGGSADAAVTLNLLNTVFALQLTVDQREAYARQLGSDCAFFVQNRPQYCVEKGDVFEEINLDLTGYFILLVYPNLAISTAEAYAGVTPRTPDLPLRRLLEAPIATWRGQVHNDFEDSLFPMYPVLAEIKQQLYELGAVYASMSGSGSTVYGIFSAPPEKSAIFSRYTTWEGKLR